MMKEVYISLEQAADELCVSEQVVKKALGSNITKKGTIRKGLIDHYKNEMLVD